MEDTQLAREGLVGREPELERIEALLAGARSGESGVLAVRGEPGIGKTALLREARARASDGFSVLSATGVEGESDIPYAALLTLLAPIRSLIGLLPEVQRTALVGALALGPPSGADKLAVGAAVLGLLDAAAERRPLLAIVDDAQWLDSASAGALLFAARRLGAERIALLLGIRDAEGAMSRGGQQAAGVAMERAARLTPAGPLKAVRLVQASELRMLAGAAQRAVGLAEEALELDPPPATRARALQTLSRLELLRGSLDEAHRRGVEAAQLIEADDPDSAVAMYLEAGLPGFMAGRIETAVHTCRRAYALAQVCPEEVSTPATVLYGAALTISGRFEEGRPLLQRWLEVHVPERMLMSPPELIGATQSITWIEEYDGCLAVCDQVIELARTQGAAGPLQLTLAQRAEVHYRLGHWTQSRADASESVRMAEATGQAAQASFPLVVLSRLEAAVGLSEETGRHTQELAQVAAASGMGSMAAYVAAVQCLDHLGSGDVAAAAERGREVREIVEGFGMLDPSVIQWRGDFIEALVKSSREDEARTELETFAEQAERTGRPWPNAAVARCRGLLAPDDAIDAAFEAALAWHARGADPFERARTELSYGERLRRARRPADARAHLPQLRPSSGWAPSRGLAAPVPSCARAAAPPEPRQMPSRGSSPRRSWRWPCSWAGARPTARPPRPCF